MSAASFPMKESTIAMTAAIPMTKVEYTLVIASTPIFSPYVVLGVEPTKLEIIVETPFPMKERSSLRCFVKSPQTIFPTTNRCPICSEKRKRDADKIRIILDQSNLMVYNSGITIQEASSSKDKSRMPKLQAMM